MVTTDPVIRYTAGGILVAAFCGAVAIVVHGYWIDPHYTIPTTIDALLSAALAGALTLLGVHVGVNGAEKGAEVVQRTIQNGLEQQKQH